MDSRVSVGYYGRPGGYGGLVHLTVGGRPVCGVKHHPDAEYQWCSWSERSYVECGRCRRSRMWRLLNEIARAKLDALMGRTNL